MKKKLDELITKLGEPTVLIDNWEGEHIGHGIWGFEDTIIWDEFVNSHLSSKDNKLNEPASASNIMSNIAKSLSSKKSSGKKATKKLSRLWILTFFVCRLLCLKFLV